MKAALRDARVAAAVERGATPKPKRSVAPKPVKVWKYPRLAHDTPKKGTLVVRAPQRRRGTRAALAKRPPTEPGRLDPRAFGPLPKFSQGRGRPIPPQRGAKSSAAAQQRGTRTPERRKAVVPDRG